MNRVYLVGKGNKRAGPRGFSSQDEALRLLRQAAAEHDNLQHFRETWRTDLRGGATMPASDRQVLDYLARRLADGALKVAGKPQPEPDPGRTGSQGGGTAPPPPAAEAPPPPPKSPALKLRPRPEVPVDQLPDPIFDALKQADCLMSAAQDGLPFCEQCAKF
ncbi:MAG: hypothetical protein ABI832_10690 [bacterium]